MSFEKKGPRTAASDVAAAGGAGAIEEAADEGLTGVTYGGSGGGPPDEVGKALGHWTEDDATALDKRMRNARRAISGRADGSVREAGAAGITLGAELLGPAASAGMGELGGDRAVRAISAGQEIAREQRAMAEVLAVQSESETLTAAAQRASVAEQIADPQERERALLLLDRIDRDRQQARSESAAVQLDARAATHPGRVIDQAVGEEAATIDATNASARVESATPEYAARLLDKTDRRELGKWEQGLPAENRAGLAPIAEHMQDPLRAASVRETSVAGTRAGSWPELWARMRVTGSGLLGAAEHLTGTDLDASEAVERSRTDLLMEEVSSRHGVDLDNEPELRLPVPVDASKSWEPADLRIVDEVLGRLPPTHLQAVGNVNRAQTADRSAAGYAWSDSGTALLDPAFEGGAGRMSEADPLAARAGPASWLEDVLTHEIGHRVGHRNGGNLYREFFSVAGLDSGKTPQQIAPDGDRWNYARTSRNEYFAEMYSSAVNSPTRLYGELMSGPQRDLAKARREARAQGDGADPRSIRQAKETAQAREAQWRFMREQVFGVNEGMVAQRVAQLQTSGGAGESRASAFSREARKVMTPHQLEALYQRYAGTTR